MRKRICKESFLCEYFYFSVTEFSSVSSEERCGWVGRDCRESPLSLPPDDFLPVHGLSLPVAEDLSVRSVLDVGDDAEGFVDPPFQFQKVEKL